MEKDGWQIAFLSTSRHHLHPAKICQPSQSSTIFILSSVFYRDRRMFL